MEPTWCWWENWTGWTRATPWRVKDGERLIASKNQNMRATKNTAPKTDPREIVFVLGWKICIAEPGRSIWQRLQLSRDCPEDRRHRWAAQRTEFPASLACTWGRSAPRESIRHSPLPPRTRAG